MVMFHKQSEQTHGVNPKHTLVMTSAALVPFTAPQWGWMDGGCVPPLLLLFSPRDNSRNLLLATPASAAYLPRLCALLCPCPSWDWIIFH